MDRRSRDLAEAEAALEYRLFDLEEKEADKDSRSRDISEIEAALDQRLLDLD